MRPFIRQGALRRIDLLGELCQFGAQRLGAFLHGAQVRLRPTKLDIVGARHRQAFGRRTFFANHRFGEA